MDELDLKALEAQLQKADGLPFQCGTLQLIGRNAFCTLAKMGVPGRQKIIKWGPTKTSDSFLESEFIGNANIAATGTIGVPAENFFGRIHEHSVHCRQWIDEEERTSKFWEDLGRKLARMHRKPVHQCGWDRDNFIGTLEQHNVHTTSWTEFFMEYRLKHLARSYPRVFGAEVMNALDALHAKMDTLYPSQSPSLLHGDLWSGNILCGSGQRVFLVDPSVYRGNREMDLAMSCLFGGFDDDFYAAYGEEYPLERGWRERVDLWNLYPLMVHSVLFGGRYVEQFRKCLNRFTA